MQESTLWGWEARGQMPTEPARVSVPLRTITSAKKLHKVRHTDLSNSRSIQGILKVSN